MEPKAGTPEPRKDQDIPMLLTLLEIGFSDEGVLVRWPDKVKEAFRDIAETPAEVLEYGAMIEKGFADFLAALYGKQ